LNRGQWRASAAAIVFPGGADRLYFEELESKGGNRQISEFVRDDGGCYVGFCAGAYYGCSRVEFDLNGPLEVNEDRTLNFYKGAGVGPVFDGFDYHSEKGSRAASILRTDNGQSVDIYFNGGCFFQDVAEDLDDEIEQYQHDDTSAMTTTRITSYYATADVSDVSDASNETDSSGERLIAASVEILMRNGGTVILCGVHPEYLPHQMLSPNGVPSVILRNDEARCEYLKYLLSPLLR
jgi:biotin--protein ligase